MFKGVVGSSGEFTQPVYMCFVDLEKAYDHVAQAVGGSQGVGVLREYGVDGLLL